MHNYFHAGEEYQDNKVTTVGREQVTVHVVHVLAQGTYDQQGW
ncbi:MAG TPA: hypothetical protein VIE89_21655 [Candidatus Binatia bacterium]